jgi:arylsulfatase A
VPLVVRWPGRVPAGRVEEGLVSQMDLFATLAGIVGAEIPAGSAEDSLDQAACLFGTGPSRRTTLVHNTAPGKYALREGDWVYIDAPTGGISQVPEWYVEQRGDRPHGQPGELYNLRDDLSQRHNRYADEPRRVDDLRQRLHAIVGPRLTPGAD